MIANEVEIEKRERLGQILRELRGDESLRKFGKRMGCSGVAISDWEHGHSFPGLPYLEKIAELKGWSLYQLLAYIRNEEITCDKDESTEELYNRAVALPREERIKMATMLLSADSQ